MKTELTLVLLLLLLSSCGDNASKMMKLGEGLKTGQNYSFKYMNVRKVQGHKEKDGTITSQITLSPHKEFDYSWTFMCKCDLTDYESHDFINIDTTKNIITSHGSPWPGMGMAMLFVTMLGISTPIAYGISRVVWLGFIIFVTLGLYAKYILSKKDSKSANDEKGTTKTK